MNEQITIQTLLNKRFEEIRLKNSSFSLRAFSKRLDVSPSTLTRILAGERRVSRPLAEQLCDKLCLDPQERSEIMGKFPQRKRYRKATRTGDAVDPNYLQLTADQFRIVGEWYHFAILSLIKTRDFRSDADWVADRLGISNKEASAALERLNRLEMIQKDSTGNWTRTYPRLRTTDDVLNLSLQKAHRQNLELGLEVLSNVPVELRDFSAITMPTNPKLLPKAKELIRKFQDDLSALLESEPGTEVYKFCTQLIPLTKPKKVEKLK
jgi:uncharacterized protein (TIGR02147 family)